MEIMLVPVAHIQTECRNQQVEHFIPGWRY